MHVPAPSSNRPVLPPGNYDAVIVRVIDLGTQDESYQDEPRKKRKVRIEVEVPEELALFRADAAPEPHVVGRDYTLSLNKGAKLVPGFLKAIEGIRGKPFADQAEANLFNTKKLLGVPCSIIVVNVKRLSDGTPYPKIEAFGPRRRSWTPPAKTFNEVFEYEVKEGKGGRYAELLPFVKKKLDLSYEFRGASISQPDAPQAEPSSRPPATVAPAADEADDDVPF